MPATCKYCGEYKPCRKKWEYAWLTFRPEALYCEWICQECDIAKNIKQLKDSKKRSDEQDKEKLNWKKERDKILKQHGKK